MSKWVCKICILKNGLRGSDLKNWPDHTDEPAIRAHLKDVHGITVLEYSSDPTPANIVRFELGDEP